MWDVRFNENDADDPKDMALEVDIGNRSGFILIEKHICPLPPTAILAFRQSIIQQTPSVFDADQRGIGQFFLSGLGHQKFGLNLNPGGNPTGS